MTEQLAAVVFWAILLLPFAVFVKQARSVRRGTRGPARAAALFFAYSLLPALAYAGVFFLLVGVEELTGRAVIDEGFARMLAPTLGIALAEVLLLTLIFALSVAFLRRAGRHAD